MGNARYTLGPRMVLSKLEKAGVSAQCRQVKLPIIAICYPMIANPRVKTHGCYKANPMNGVKTKNHNLPNFFDPI